MAPPLFLAEQAMMSFIREWLCGLQPSLVLSTNSDGSIFISSKVTSFPVKPTFYNNTCSTRRSHRSGKNARERRKLRRTSKMNEESRSILPQLYSESQPPIHVHHALKPTQVDAGVQITHELVDSPCQTDPAPPPPSKLLSTTKLAPLSIPPRIIYHPAIINATKSFYNKHPSELSCEESTEFKFYLDQKQARGQPVERDLIYLPTSMRNCLHCGHPT